MPYLVRQIFSGQAQEEFGRMRAADARAERIAAQKHAARLRALAARAGRRLAARAANPAAEARP